MHPTVCSAAGCCLQGTTKVALYGLGNVRDERLGRMFQTPGCVDWCVCTFHDCHQQFMLTCLLSVRAHAGTETTYSCNLPVPCFSNCTRKGSCTLPVPCFSNCTRKVELLHNTYTFSQVRGMGFAYPWLTVWHTVWHTLWHVYHSAVVFEKYHLVTGFFGPYAQHASCIARDVWHYIELLQDKTSFERGDTRLRLVQCVCAAPEPSAPLPECKELHS